MSNTQRTWLPAAPAWWTALRARFAGQESGGERVPIRDWVGASAAQPSRALGFDQALVWVVMALLLLGLGADQAPGKLVVILGGDGKGQDFAPLAAPVAQHARAVALVGKDAADIERALSGCGVPLQRHATLEAATAWCFEQAQAGDAVLLSPACSSLDMYRNYGHRAEVFVAAVQQHAQAQGAVL